ncbi:hypothetical protein ACS0ZG_37645 [Burkholderia gladioli]|uniref:hypothetical protein n=1 Tax=Burkholderia gladioli TaxID=28095 RepID=UPI000FDB06F0|nr:hypothetical protein [Burkholderia gladioli]
MFNVNLKELNFLVGKISGEIVISASRIHGSYFMLEIGEPHLQVREPLSNTTHSPNSAASRLRRRQARVVGDWTFSVSDSNWEFFDGDDTVKSTSDGDKIDEFFAILTGQRLKEISVAENFHTVLAFDEGARLELRPDPELPNEDQWRLYSFIGLSFGITNDGIADVDFSGFNRK